MTVRIGIIGLGNIGSGHVETIKKLDGLKLAAVCDMCPERMERYDDVKKYTDSRELIRSGEVDAAIVATPHYDHTTIGIDALEQGLHVLVEKPISVHKADCERLIAAHKNPKQIFAAMFNQRTDPHYARVRRLIQNGELGEIRRVNWIVTSWFRSEQYYASGGWRATWKGEGGGVLLNQCPHNLDLLQWICGMPVRVRAFCHLGKYHNIEVEDEVTAYLEYPNGATGVFITSTGEAPGTNRFEITGDRGKVVIEGNDIRFTRTEVDVQEFNRTTKESFSQPETWDIAIPAWGNGEQHYGIIKNFRDAIANGAELVAPAEEGIHSVELANAMLYSSLLGETVEVPLDGAAFETQFKRLIAESRFEKNAVDEKITSL
jgi:predicted dehydrogenase